MKYTQAMGSLIFLIVFFGGIYYMYNQGNIAFFFRKTAKVNAQIDSIKPVRGFAGKGWNQKVYFSYEYNEEKYSSYFKNDATKWNLIRVNDSLQIKISIKNPGHTKVIGVYFTN